VEPSAADLTCDWGLVQVEAPWNRVDRDPHSMWSSSTGQQLGTQAPRKRKEAEPIAANDALVKQVQRLALHAALNIEHKDQLPLFVPAQYIMSLATHVSALRPTALHPSAKLSSK
jgi:hypothetical protein